MNKDTPLVLAAATYSNRDDAVNDFKSVTATRSATAREAPWR